MNETLKLETYLDQCALHEPADVPV